MRPVGRLGVLGGTFDPPHQAHLALATAARRSLDLDLVLFVPAGDPWRKRGRPITSAAHRLAMVEAALAGSPDCAVSDLELRRPGPSYTSDTLRALVEQGHDAIWFIVGADALLDLPYWHAPGEIVRLARLAVAARPGRPVDVAALDAQVPGLAAALDWVAMTPIDLSATALRARLEARSETGGLIPGPVRAYIRAHSLYPGAP